jgi:poly-beta-1,6-N-acetyl-D-glucosamine biosynthesis protein PgaD
VTLVHHRPRAVPGVRKLLETGEPAWPPLITHVRRPLWILVRDILITLLMWGLLALILYTEAELVWNAVQVLMRKPDVVIDAQLDLFWRRMQPLLYLMAVLVLLLAAATLVSRNRREKAIRQAPPPPLPEADVAARAGMDPAALAAARQHRIGVVHVGEGGVLRVEPRALPPPIPLGAELR